MRTNNCMKEEDDLKRLQEEKVVPIKDGTSSNGVPYLSFICSNNEAGLISLKQSMEI